VTTVGLPQADILLSLQNQLFFAQLAIFIVSKLTLAVVLNYTDARVKGAIPGRPNNDQSDISCEAAVLLRLGTSHTLYVTSMGLIFW